MAILLLVPPACPLPTALPYPTKFSPASLVKGEVRGRRVLTKLVLLSSGFGTL
jgi:hypothetical protein